MMALHDRDRPDSLSRRLLRRSATGARVEGSALVEVTPDLVLGHDATIALIVERVAGAGARLAHPERAFLVADHFAPPSSVDRANILRKFLDFVESSGVGGTAGGTFEMMSGISHQVLVESERCVPGSVIVGADSHTTMAGALGTFACGLGSTDILAVLLTGRTWLELPPAERVTFVGSMAPWLRGKDLALWMMGTWGEGGGAGRSLEFVDATTDWAVPMDGRLTVCNMAVDCGATNGLWVPDAVTKTAWGARGTPWPDLGSLLDPAPDSAYERTHAVDLGGLSPRVACPEAPSNVTGVEEVAGERVHQVFIGSCAGGRLEEIGDAVRLLRGRKVPRLLKVIVTPASSAVAREAMRRGWLADLMDAGAVVTNASCGACGGVDKGLLAAGEACLSTSNRNHRGRMGHPDARIYLASGLVAAATALTGRITDPREVMD